MQLLRRKCNALIHLLTLEYVITGTSGVVTPYDRTTNPGLSTPEDHDNFPGPPSPMQKVKTKLAVWSWAREQGLDALDGGPKWLPLLDPDGGATHNSTASRSPLLTPPKSREPASTATASSPRSFSDASPQRSDSADRNAAIATIPAEDDEDEPPLELKAKSTGSRSPSIKRNRADDYLSIPVLMTSSAPTSPSEPQKPSLPRQLSNLAIEETHFTTHRDSVDLLQHRKQHEAKVNQHLMNARDSAILTRSIFNESYPKTSVDVRLGRSRTSTMTSIPDVSPPEAGRATGSIAKKSSLRGASPVRVGCIRGGLDEDEGDHET